MIRKREKTFLKGAFLIVLFYTIVEHIETVKNILRFAYQAISPLIYGIVIAFILNLMVVSLEKHMQKGIFKNQSFRRTTSIIISILLLIGTIVIICFNMVPEVTESVKQIAEKVPPALEKTMDFLEKELGLSDDILKFMQNFKFDEDLVNSMLGLVKNQSFIQAIKASGDVVGGFFSVIFKFFIGLFFAFYIVAKKEAICAFMYKFINTYLPEKIAGSLLNFGKITYETFANFISGQCMDAVILGCLMAICMGIMQLSYPILIGIVIAVTALIPVVGSFFGGAVGVVLLIIDSPVKALTFLILFLIIQQIDNRLIYPHIVGNAIGIPSILIFAAIVIGGELGGVLGMFVGIPFTAVIYTIIIQDMEKRALQKQQDKEKAEETEDEKEQKA